MDHSFHKTRPLLLGSFIISFFTTSCIDAAKFMVTASENNQSSGSVNIPSQIDGGAIFGDINAQSKDAQKLFAPDGTELSGSSVIFAPGSFAINTQVRMEAGADLASIGFGAELGLGDAGMNAASSALVIDANADLVPGSVLTVAIAMGGGSGLALDDTYKNLAIIYQGKSLTKDGQAVIGLIPRSQITVKDGIITFTTSRLGSFQAVFLDVIIEEKKETETTRTILTRSQERALPQINWVGVFLEGDRTGIKAYYKVEGVILQSCIVIIDTDKQKPWNYVGRMTSTSYFYKPEWDASHALSAQFECLDSHGRMLRSPWTPDVNIPARQLQSSTSNSIAPIVPPPGSIIYPLRHDSLSQTPQISWDPVDILNLSHYELSIGTSPTNTANTMNWTNVGKATSYVNQLTLNNGKLYFAAVRTVDTAGNKSEITVGSHGWQNLFCPVGYIKIHGNETPGLGGPNYYHGSRTRVDGIPRLVADFCVMKYEAKIKFDTELELTGVVNYGSIDTSKLKPISVPNGKPWTIIKKTAIDGIGINYNAQHACASVGLGFQLINNAQWQTIARDIELTKTNWYDSSDTTLASNTLNNGFTTGSEPLAANDNDQYGCIGSGDVIEDCNPQWQPTKRTHNLKGGAVIWDFAGNVAEWVFDELISLNYEGSHSKFITEAYSNDLRWGPMGDHSAKIPSINYSYGGMGYFDVTGSSNQIVVRGGKIGNGNNAGIFAVTLSDSVGENDNIGFRCVYAP